MSAASRTWGSESEGLLATVGTAQEMMLISVGDIRRLIWEAAGAVKMLDTLASQIILKGKDVKIEEVITGIRVIKGVATVIQNVAVKRVPGGRRVLDVLITIDPKDLEMNDYLERLAGTIKQIDGVSHLVLISLNGKPLRDPQGRKPVY